MGRRGSALDNAVCESAFATLKCELVHRRTFRTRDQAREEIFRWIEGWYNTRRRHSSLGYLSPAEFEQNFHDRQNAEALASDLRPSSSAGKVNTSTDHGPFGPVDPDQPASLGALAGVEPLPTSNRKLSTKVR